MLTKYTKFNLHITFDGNRQWAEDALVAPGIASLFKALSTFCPDHAVSISSGAKPNFQDTNSGQISSYWMMWARKEGKDHWTLEVTGAEDLDDMSVELLNLLEQGRFEEIRICPPGAHLPRQVTA